MTDEAKAARRVYERQWRAKNPDKVKARNERYWAKKAQEMREQEESESEQTES